MGRTAEGPLCASLQIRQCVEDNQGGYQPSRLCDHKQARHLLGVSGCRFNMLNILSATLKQDVWEDVRVLGCPGVKASLGKFLSQCEPVQYSSVLNRGSEASRVISKGAWQGSIFRGFVPSVSNACGDIDGPTFIIHKNSRKRNSGVGCAVAKLDQGGVCSITSTNPSRGFLKLLRCCRPPQCRKFDLAGPIDQLGPQWCRPKHPEKDGTEED